MCLRDNPTSIEVTSLLTTVLNLKPIPQTIIFKISTFFFLFNTIIIAFSLVTKCEKNQFRRLYRIDLWSQKKVPWWCWSKKDRAMGHPEGILIFCDQITHLLEELRVILEKSTLFSRIVEFFVPCNILFGQSHIDFTTRRSVSNLQRFRVTSWRILLGIYVHCISKGF